MLAACIVPPVSWYFTSTLLPTLSSSVTFGFVPAASAFRVFVPAPRAVTVVELSTANFMSCVPTFTVTESAATAVTVPVAVFSLCADTRAADQTSASAATEIARTVRLIAPPCTNPRILVGEDNTPKLSDARSISR
jgi:hypothetical protein